jgi:WD40 repeat protein
VAFLELPSGGRLVGQPFVRDTLVSSVASSSDGRFVFGGAVDMTAAIFEVESGATVMEATDHAEGIVAIFDDGVRVGWATTGGSIWLCRDGASPEKCLVTGEHWSEVTFHESRALVRTLDGSIVLWSFAGERTVLYAPDEPSRGMWARDATTLHIDAVRMHFPEGGTRLVLRDRHGTTVIERTVQLVRVVLSPRGDVIATHGWANELELWQAATGELRHSLPCPGGSGCFAFSPDGELVATGEIGHGGGLYPRQVYVYEVGSGRRCLELSGHQWQVRQVAFSPDGRLLASLGDDVLVWDLSKFRWFKKEPLLRVRLDRVTGAFAFAGTRLVVLERGRVRIFEQAVERLSFEAPIEFETPWTISQDGKHLCIGGNQAVFRYDLATGSLERAIVADVLRPERLPSVPIAQEHRIRGGAMLWRTQQGCFLHQSDGPRGWVEPLDLSPDGLVAVPCESRVAIFRVDPISTSLLGFVPFEGKLRAGRVAGGEVLLVNETGRCFRKSMRDVRADYRRASARRSS